MAGNQAKLNLFSGNVTSEGRPHLGAAIGSKEYVKTFAESKTKEWLSNVKCLGVTQPHAAYISKQDNPRHRTDAIPN